MHYTYLFYGYSTSDLQIYISLIFILYIHFLLMLHILSPIPIIYQILLWYGGGIRSFKPIFLPSLFFCTVNQNFLNILKKNPGQEQEIKISRITDQRKKRKKFHRPEGKKERKDQPRLTPWKSLIKGCVVSGQKKTEKTFRECCNATITKVLNTKQWSQLYIFRDLLYIYIYIYIYIS